ncbi:antibiotic biosynthesis monooxygenase [Microvirga arsenatis]|uniref:ABM domain-containing protein n=1 Tax=Microvirga arsenatis TaxID=2692265 RepID=A0ABW9Z3X2_9HYPH|nr:antibiotic biosynthesis monooxygenase [Microvirga arsenatis]NBJ13939.1 hypothetical protein [Microvirga arsenatis]NBJ27389.1 hypothetical protein [Microvirga arsenatis]
MSVALRPSDPSVSLVQACRWRFVSEAVRAAAVHDLRMQTPSPVIELFADVEQPALLATIWGVGPGPEPASDPWPPGLTAGAEIEWVADAEIMARWRASGGGEPGCLVVVRQPLIRPDNGGQRDWAATVLRALDGDPSPPAGLLTANFFASRDGGSVLNFAEWTSPAAHRDALARGSYGQHGSIGSSALWRATREHPAITPDHEVHRYVPCIRRSHPQTDEAA